MAGSERDWVTRMVGEAPVALRSNSHYATLAAAEAGMGVGVAGLLHFQAAGRNLVRLAPPEAMPPRELWLAPTRTRGIRRASGR